ncbi:MAG: histidinol-phosphate transaminase [Bacteroidetes bacterium]|nr:MAG: histidinol-phosphate transaminase [Bacteroidota bacterium]
MRQLDDLVRPNIRKLQPYRSARDEFSGPGRVFLDANESPFGTGLNRYPDPLQRELKEAIAHLKGVPPERIFLGNGSDEVIDLLFRIFCEPGQDRAIVLPPTYGMYGVCAGVAGVEVLEVPLRPDFQPQVEAILGAADERAKLLFLCSPNNPSGNDLQEDALRQLLGTFPGIVVVDEAYIDFSDRPSCIHWLERYPNLVVLQTFSKAWGLAGIRLGMAFAGEPLIALLNKVKPPYNVNRLTQQAALEALRRPQIVRQNIQTLLRERARLRDALGHYPFVEKVFPSDANFLLVRVRDADGLYAHLLERGIVVRNRSRQLHCAGCLRITVGTSEENTALLKALDEWKS